MNAVLGGLGHCCVADKDGHASGEGALVLSSATVADVPGVDRGSRQLIGGSVVRRGSGLEQPTLASPPGGRMAAKSGLDQAGINIPFPQRTLWLAPSALNAPGSDLTR